MGNETELVRHFRQILFWPLQLVTAEDKALGLLSQSEQNPWTEVVDEFTGDLVNSKRAITVSSSLLCPMCSDSCMAKERARWRKQSRLACAEVTHRQKQKPRRCRGF
jgi:hypothetical protein